MEEARGWKEVVRTTWRCWATSGASSAPCTCSPMEGLCLPGLYPVRCGRPGPHRSRRGRLSRLPRRAEPLPCRHRRRRWPQLLRMHSSSSHCSRRCRSSPQSSPSPWRPQRPQPQQPSEAAICTRRGGRPHLHPASAPLSPAPLTFSASPQTLTARGRMDALRLPPPRPYLLSASVRTSSSHAREELLLTRCDTVTLTPPPARRGGGSRQWLPQHTGGVAGGPARMPPRQPPLSCSRAVCPWTSGTWRFRPCRSRRRGRKLGG
mmetsp:Transcript_21113/g.61386  ORF Transcript_21113/g.61386 Transcript_21113/m.61386 type:complete len:263 (+) Transcript_21113:988-1776(+)